MKSKDSITDILGIEVGHAQDDEALTGCTVIFAAKARSLAWTCAALHPARVKRIY